jgi:organic radical activating enzyme
MWNFIRKLYKKKLDKISPSLCLAKWTQSNIYLSSGMTHSCHHPKAHVIPIHEIKKNPSALHNTQHKIEQRKLMLSGIRPSECDYCWRIEDQNNISDRITKSFNSWSRPFFNKIVKEGSELDIPKYIEVSFDNTCNLKCSYCGPQYSSKWVEELERYGEWPESVNHYKQYNIIHNNEDNPYTEAFWLWFPEVYKNLDTFRITGGEPLLSKNTFKVLDYIVEHPNKELNLSINSNLSVPKTLIDMLVNKLKNVKVKTITIHASCDTYGKAAEYSRHGLDYNNWISNCKYILKEIPNVKLDIMVTYNVFCVTTFIDFLKDINVLKQKPLFSRQRVNVSISYLRGPDQLAFWVLPTEFVSCIKNQLTYMKNNSFTKTEINQLSRLIPLFDSIDDNQRHELQHKFKIFVDEHDKRRNTNFIQNVPTLTEFYKSCK